MFFVGILGISLEGVLVEVEWDSYVYFLFREGYVVYGDAEIV